MEKVNKTKKIDPYTCSKNSTANNRIVNNFMQGIYYNNSTHTKELLSTNINRYNMNIVGEINELNSQFRQLIIVYDIIAKFISEHKDFSYGDARNIYRLMHAQSGTMKFNYLLKKSLKKYAVNKQIIYDQLKLNMKSQCNRVKRNKQLILQLLADYGMNNLADLVKEDTGMDIFEHADEFSNKLKENIVIVTDEDEKKFYNDIKDKYIEYLKELAVKYNVNIFEDISKTLEERRQLKIEKSLEIKQENKEIKEKNREDRLMQILIQDGAYIQSDIDNATYIIESNTQGQKLGFVVLNDLRKKLNEYSKVVYYIATTVNGGIKYVSDNDTLTTSIRSAKFFNDKNKANEYVQQIKQNELWSKLVIAVIKLINNKGNAKVALSNYAHNPIKNIQNIISIEDELDSIALIVKIINSAYGVDYKGNSGEVAIYVCEQHPNKVLCKNEKDNKLFIGNIHENPVIVSKDNIHKKVSLGGYSFKPNLFTFNSGWYSSLLNNIREENLFIQNLIDNKPLDTLEKYYYDHELTKFTCELNKIKNKISKLVQLKELKDGCVYYVAIHNITKFVSIRDIQYTKKRNRKLITPYANEMDVYTNYNEAINMANRLLNYNKDNIYIICKIDCTQYM